MNAEAGETGDKKIAWADKLQEASVRRRDTTRFPPHGPSPSQAPPPDNSIEKMESPRLSLKEAADTAGSGP